MRISRTLVTAIVFMLLTGFAQAQNRNRRYVEYIERYSNVAVEQMREHKIPASITLAQGLLESGAGQSELARKSNNHFGIKCADWNGKSVRHNDDARDECFRAYDNPGDSYEDHSLFLTSRPRYAFLFHLDITDYRAWARGLKNAGYATDPSYANRLIQIIEDYELYKYDQKQKSKRSESKASHKAQVVVINVHQVYLANNLLYVLARRGDTFESIADEFETSARKLIKYNELQKDYTLVEGDIVYLHAKNKKAVGKYNVHIVGGDDSMHSISQRYGIKLKYLYRMNNKDGDYVPEVGDRLRLR